MIPERIIVSATVKSRGEEIGTEGSKGFALELEIPQFKSKYPTKVTRVPEAVAKLLTPRTEPYSVVLLREHLKKDKTGTQPYDYYWGVEGLATPEEKAVAVAKPDPLDERDHRIMRSTALAQAVAYLHEASEGPGITVGPAVVLEVAAEFYVWLRDGPQAHQATQDVAPTPTALVPAPETAQTPSAVPESVGELLTRATMQKGNGGRGYKNRSDIEIASLSDTWEKLQEEPR